MMRKFITGLVLAVSVSGCHYDKAELLYPGTVDCSTGNVLFSANVQPIIQTRCAIAGCHDASSVNIGGPFTDYTLVKNKASIIKTLVSNGTMPQGSALTPNQIQLITCWISNGALNN